jgi:glycosyltransferase involved in cell wall biosynthesis
MGLVRSRLLAALLHAATDPLYRSARVVVTLSAGMREQIAQRPTAPARIHVLENGTQPERFRPAPEDPSVLRLVYIGAVGRANGLNALAEVARRVLAQRSGVRFEVCGWGSHWAALAAATADLAAFRLVPAQPKDEVAHWLHGAAIGLCVFAPLPVLEANSANKFFDYLAAGLPVVLNYGGWQAALLEEAGCGRWAPAGDLATWERVLLELIDAPDLRREMGGAARRLACQRFDRRQLAAQALDLLGAAAQPLSRPN